MESGTVLAQTLCHYIIDFIEFSAYPRGGKSKPSRGANAHLPERKKLWYGNGTVYLSLMHTSLPQGCVALLGSDRGSGLRVLPGEGVSDREQGRGGDGNRSNDP